MYVVKSGLTPCVGPRLRVASSTGLRRPRVWTHWIGNAPNMPVSLYGQDDRGTGVTHLAVAHERAENALRQSGEY